MSSRIAVFIALLSAAPTTLAAQPTTKPVAAKKAQRSTGKKRAPRLRWQPHWPRASWWEVGSIAIGAGLLAYVQFGTFTNPKAKWQSGILFDDWMRDAIRAGTRDARETTNLLSDVTWGIAWGIAAVDVALVSLLDRDPDLFWQIAVMDAQVFLWVAALARISHKTFKRERPLAVGCRKEGPSYDAECGGAPADFFSGHTAMAFGAAGVTCAHHANLPLWGGRWADRAACASAIVAASATGILRVVADRHHFSSVLVGAAVGFGLGYGLPRLLHYRNRQKTTRKTSEGGSRVWLVPMTVVDGPRLGLALGGLF